MPGISTREKEIRREKLLKLLPEHGWSVPKAGPFAGYSKLYSKKRLPEIIKGDVEFCRLILAQRQAIEATTADKRENALAKLQSIADDPKARHSDVIRAIEVMGRVSGWMSETRVLELPDRQRVLSEAEREEARRIALWRFDTTGGIHYPAETPGEQPSGESSAEQKRLTGS